MGRGRRETELGSGGLKLWARFVLATSIALSVVMAIGGAMLYSTTTRLSEAAREEALVRTVQVTADELVPGNFEQRPGSTARLLAGGRVRRFEVQYGIGRNEGHPGVLYETVDPTGRAGTRILSPLDAGHAGRGLLGLIVGISFFVLLAGIGVAYAVANQVARPLEEVIEDIRQIAHGNLQHRTRVRGGGEIKLLARAIDRMTSELADARERDLQHRVRERELEVAREVREALLPTQTPDVPGYDLGALHVGAPSPGGDFHDFIDAGDGRVVFLVAGVTGKGVPGALVGATARAYLRTELGRGGALEEVLARVNRALVQDVRRGMCVSVLCVELDPKRHRVRAACAGHKVPLLRLCASDGKLRLVQPEGIALGFDRGPVFERRLEVVEFPIETGDRLLVANEGALQVTDPGGEELGERAFFRMVMKLSREKTPVMLENLEVALSAFADDTPYPNDISIVSVMREA